MKVIVISPEGHDPREYEALRGFLACGLERYHVRKPGWLEEELEAWILGLPVETRRRLVLHQHHSLAPKLGLLGIHEKDSGISKVASNGSRSCHDMDSLMSAFGKHPYVIFGPVFPSLTKQGYGPEPDYSWEEFRKTLVAKKVSSKTLIYAIGGITAEVLPQCAHLGFDGVAVLGSLWMSPVPVAAYTELRQAADKLEASPRAA